MSVIMRYVSTRGLAPAASFEDALLAGLARDGGLFLPETWPRLSPEGIDGIGDASFADAAAVCLAPFVGRWIDGGELRVLMGRAFSAFDRKEVAPLVRLGERDWLLELFHGPTLAFKDIAMQALGLMFDRALAEQGTRATIIGATSGDTGAAAIEAFRGRDQIDIFILHPAGKVSDVQRRMMTTAAEANVFNIAVDGAFDDCQRLVKALFGDEEFKNRVRLSAVNSINWARLAVQVVYYFTGLAQLEKGGGGRSASFCVPTGNFGDAFAGYAAQRMGARIDRLALGVNRNDILRRALATGIYRPARTEATTSPAMDIQVASNFERLLFEASDRDSAALRDLMKRLDKEGGFEIPTAWLERIGALFDCASVSEDENKATITRVFRENGMLVDPHTAVGLAAARKLRDEGRLTGDVITLATAHPAKFPDAVSAATGKTPALPERLRGLFDKPERCVSAPADPVAIRDLVLARSRAAKH